MSGKAVRDTIGFIGVVASLVFVGLEIRQNTAMARGQTRQDLAALNQEYLLLRVTSPELSDLMSRAWMLEGDLTGLEATRANWMMRLVLRRLENVYLQYSEGLVDESALNSYGLLANATFECARFSDFWVTRDERAVYDPEFVRFFEDRLGLPSG
jgi:hypothetical protein